MEQHPISDLMGATMSKIKEMIDVNTIIGTPIATANGYTIIPVSKVSFGFASGGSDFQTKNQQPTQNNAFGGGSGAGININPIAFLIVSENGVKLLPITAPANTTLDRIVELVPDVIDKLSDLFNKDKDEEVD